MNDAHRLAVLSEVKRNKVFAILRGVQSNDIESVVQALVDELGAVVQPLVVVVQPLVVVVPDQTAFLPVLRDLVESPDW
jgi:hypothetical protein